MLLRDIGRGEEVHEIDTTLLIESSRQIKLFSEMKTFNN
jgi:hypothetical protein